MPFLKKSANGGIIKFLYSFLSFINNQVYVGIIVDRGFIYSSKFRLKMCENSNSTTENFINATIIVIGDIGHSPRMCNHAYSLACEGVNVRLVGYIDSMPHENITLHKNIRFFSLLNFIFFLFLV